MEIPTPACALVRNDNVVRGPSFLYKFQFIRLKLKADTHIILYLISSTPSPGPVIWLAV